MGFEGGFRVACRGASDPAAEGRVKLQPDRIEGVNAIVASDPGRVRVVRQPEGGPPVAVTFDVSVVVPWQGDVQPWHCDAFDALTAEHFERIAALGPELVVVGSGARLRFVHPSLLRALIGRRIGVETMDTPAACRTYNVLVAEGRSVVAALLL